MLYHLPPSDVCGATCEIGERGRPGEHPGQGEGWCCVVWCCVMRQAYTRLYNHVIWSTEDSFQGECVGVRGEETAIRQIQHITK
jgi:hypothetical protein